MLAMHALHAARACGDADCNWTSAVSAIEWQSGLFFLLGGLVGALSVCRSLERGAPRRSLLVTAAVRGAVLAATATRRASTSSSSVSSRRSPCARCGSERGGFCASCRVVQVAQ